MPIDERAKATVRAVLDRHPRGCVAELTEDTVTNTATGLFRLMCVSILAEDIVPSDAEVRAARALFGRRLHSAPEMIKSDDRQRADLLRQAGYPRPDEAARQLGEATRMVIERYDGDLQRLRSSANGDPRRLRELLHEIPGMEAAGTVVFLREAQMFWPEAGPFVDERAAEAARRLDLPAEPGELLDDVARGGGTEKLSWLVGALALVETNDEYDRIRRDVA
jgi:hypothetical protein